MTAPKEKAIIKAADMPDVRVGDRDARRRADAPTRRRDKVNENDDDDERDD